VHGVPDYLKVDIEGTDILCSLGLFDVDGAPRFISIKHPSSVRKQGRALTAPLRPSRSPCIGQVTSRILNEMNKGGASCVYSDIQIMTRALP
jgi:hypothetical protein